MIPAHSRQTKTRRALAERTGLDSFIISPDNINAVARWLMEVEKELRLLDGSAE